MLVKEQTGVIVIDLKPMLELRNMTPYKLSQLSGIDKDTIYKYVNGQVLYRVDYLISLKSVIFLNVSYTKLCGMKKMVNK